MSALEQIREQKPASKRCRCWRLFSKSLSVALQAAKVVWRADAQEDTGRGRGGKSEAALPVLL